MSQYGEYTKIEDHLHISKQLSVLDRKARGLIEEIEKKKGINGRKQYDKEVQSMLSILHSLSKPKLLNHNLYSSLHYYLDDMMYSEITEISQFLIEDETYPLSAVYFDKQQWLPEIPTTTVSMTYTPLITVADALPMYSFLLEYESLVQNIRSKTPHIENPKIRGKISRITRRIEWRYLKGMKILIDKLNSDFNKKIESYLQG